MKDSLVANKVSFFYLYPQLSLDHRQLLKNFISKIFIAEKKKMTQVVFIFCSDDYLLKINQHYLKHDFYTDIITFDLSAKPGKIEGEIYISVERIKDNAKAYGISTTQELRRVMFHGILHLCGYKDKVQSQIDKMRAREDYYLNLYKKYLSREIRST